MTLLEFLKQATDDEIAGMIIDVRGKCPMSPLTELVSLEGDRSSIDYEDERCCGNCENLLTEAEYEDAWMNGMCLLSKGESCPHGVDRKAFEKQEIKDILNSEM